MLTRQRASNTASNDAPKQHRNFTVAGRRPDIVMGWVGLIVGLYAFAASLITVDYDAVDGYGLFHALPIWYWLTIAALTLGFVGFVSGGHRPAAGVAVAMMTLTLHGFEPLSAPHPRFSVAWLLTGFSELVAETGSTQRLLDARFSWPGFFFLPAAISGQVNTTAWEIVLRLWPVGIMLLWVASVWLITSRLFRDRPMAPPLATWTFVLIAWTGQNYFSPQSMGTTVAAVMMVFVVSWKPVELRAVSLRQRIKWILFPDFTTPTSTVAVAVVMTLVFAVTASHPLSPVFLAMWLAVLAGAGYRIVHGMATWTMIVFLTWLSAAARPWWHSRLSGLIDDVGNVGGTLDASTTQRTSGASTERQFVLTSRIGITAGVALAVLIASIWIWRRKGRSAGLLLMFLFGAPALAIAGQPYGGEILVRVFLFAAFPAAVVIGAALDLMPRRWLSLSAIVILSVGLAPMFIVTRFGNELYETTSVEDRAALTAAYEQAPIGTLFVTDDPFLSWGFTRFNRDTGSINHQYAAGRLSPDQEALDRIIDQAKAGNFSTATIIIAESQQNWGVEVLGFEPDWLEEVAEYLDGHESITVLHHDGVSGAYLLEIDPSDG